MNKLRKHHKRIATIIFAVILSLSVVFVFTFRSVFFPLAYLTFHGIRVEKIENGDDYEDICSTVRLSEDDKIYILKLQTNYQELQNTPVIIHHIDYQSVIRIGFSIEEDSLSERHQKWDSSICGNVIVFDDTSNSLGLPIRISQVLDIFDNVAAIHSAVMNIPEYPDYTFVKSSNDQVFLYSRVNYFSVLSSTNAILDKKADLCNELNCMKMKE